jgi:transposase
MNEIPHIITERVDDIPLLLEQMQRMGLPTLFDDHFPIHGNWQGLSLGWVSTIWLSSILSRGDHRLVHVELMIFPAGPTACSFHTVFTIGCATVGIST